MTPPSTGRSPRAAWLSVLLVLCAISIYGSLVFYSGLNPVKLWDGLPRLGKWILRSWPPDFSGFPTLLYRAFETIAMATVGVSLAAAIAVPLSFLAARNTSPSPLLYFPSRWFLNALRGIDSFVFALIFVAAVGLGPFAGVLGIAVHNAGSIAKLWAESIETADSGPIDAARMSGAGGIKVFVYALLPGVMPALASTLLYLLEFNVRASTVLGIVGAGGIGQELKNSVDLLAFDRLLAIVLIILAMVTIVDAISARLRRYFA